MKGPGRWYTDAVVSLADSPQDTSGSAPERERKVKRHPDGRVKSNPARTHARVGQIAQW